MLFSQESWCASHVTRHTFFVFLHTYFTSACKRETFVSTNISCTICGRRMQRTAKVQCTNVNVLSLQPRDSFLFPGTFLLQQTKTYQMTRSNIHTYLNCTQASAGTVVHSGARGFVARIRKFNRRCQGSARSASVASRVIRLEVRLTAVLFTNLKHQWRHAIQLQPHFGNLVSVYACLHTCSCP
jgi:hypothetical protein